MTVLMSIGSPDFTGGPRMALVTARALKSAGHRLIVVSGQRPPRDQSSVLDPLRDEGIETIEETGFEHKFPDRELIRRISSLVKREAVQCMISEQQLDFKIMPFVARQTAVKLIYHVQNAARFSGNPLVQAVKRYLYRRMITKDTTHLICVSEAVRAQHVQEFKVPAASATTVDNGVDLERFRPIAPSERETIRAGLGVQPDELMLLNVGRLSLQKGQDVLLKALAAANLGGRPFKLVIVGAATCGYAADIGYESNLRQLAEHPQLAGRVIFAGWRDDIPKVLRSADIYLHSANWEGMPLAVLEALAAGLPSVSTDCAGILTGFAPGQHGDVVATGNVAAFTQAIERIIGLSDHQRLEMGRHAEQLAAANFDVTTTGKRFVSVVEQVMNGGTRA